MPGTDSVAAWNADCISRIPEKGTVGASGDLAPLSHLALGLLGEGLVWDKETGEYAPAAGVLAKNGLTPLHLKEKEGLALINGTQVCSQQLLECPAIGRLSLLHILLALAATAA